MRVRFVFACSAGVGSLCVLRGVGLSLNSRCSLRRWPFLAFAVFFEALAFPCIRGGLLALPLCGAAPTFFAAAKKVGKESRFTPLAQKRGPWLGGGSGPSGICPIAHSAQVTRPSYFPPHAARSPEGSASTSVFLFAVGRRLCLGAALKCRRLTSGRLKFGWSTSVARFCRHTHGRLLEVVPYFLGEFA